MKNTKISNKTAKTLATIAVTAIFIGLILLGYYLFFAKKEALNNDNQDTISQQSPSNNFNLSILYTDKEANKIIKIDSQDQRSDFYAPPEGYKLQDARLSNDKSKIAVIEYRAKTLSVSQDQPYSEINESWLYLINTDGTDKTLVNEYTVQPNEERPYFLPFLWKINAFSSQDNYLSYTLSHYEGCEDKHIDLTNKRIMNIQTFSCGSTRWSKDESRIAHFDQAGMATGNELQLSQPGNTEQWQNIDWNAVKGNFPIEITNREKDHIYANIGFQTADFVDDNTIVILTGILPNGGDPAFAIFEYNENGHENKLIAYVASRTAEGEKLSLPPVDVRYIDDENIFVVTTYGLLKIDSKNKIEKIKLDKNYNKLTSYGLQGNYLIIAEQTKEDAYLSDTLIFYNIAENSTSTLKINKGTFTGIL